MPDYQPFHYCEHFDVSSYCTVSVLVNQLYLTLTPNSSKHHSLELYTMSVPVASCL
jgi:hypothetical protein